MITLHLRSKHLAAKLGQGVIAAAVITATRATFITGVCYQAISKHPLDRAVERAVAHPDFALGIMANLFHVFIAVLVPTSQGQQDVEYSRGERSKVIKRFHTC